HACCERGPGRHLGLQAPRFVPRPVATAAPGAPQYGLTSPPQVPPDPYHLAPMSWIWAKTARSCSNYAGSENRCISNFMTASHEPARCQMQVEGLLRNGPPPVAIRLQCAERAAD